MLSQHLRAMTLSTSFIYDASSSRLLAINLNKSIKRKFTFLSLTCFVDEIYLYLFIGRRFIPPSNCVANDLFKTCES